MMIPHLAPSHVGEQQDAPLHNSSNSANITPGPCGNQSFNASVPLSPIGSSAAHGSIESRKRALITRIVQECSTFRQSIPESNGRTTEELMQSFSDEAMEIFAIHIPPAALREHTTDGSPRWPAHLFGYFTELYFASFHQLWPLFHSTTFQPAAAPAHLYLTIASIGATYGSQEAAELGSMTHELLRSVLVTASLDLRSSNAPSEADCQTLLLNQVFALYVGQRRSFFIAQQLEATLLVQARRIGLFRETALLPPGKAERAAQAIASETRRRLCFGIFRAHTYTALLLGTRPDRLWEELDVGLIQDESWWLNENADSAAATQNQGLDRSRSPDNAAGRPKFSELVRLFIDGDVHLASLRPVDLELLLMALIPQLWSIGRNRFCFRRMCGSNDEDQFSCITKFDAARRSKQAAAMPFLGFSEPPLKNDNLEASCDLYSLDWHSRPKLQGMKQDWEAHLEALQRWKQACEAITATKGFAAVSLDRSRIFSCHMLYHLALLHLFADMDDLHNLAWLCSRDRQWTPGASGLLKGAITWHACTDSDAAVRQAQSIFGLISTEFRTESTKRVAPNILAFSE